MSNVPTIVGLTQTAAQHQLDRRASRSGQARATPNAVASGRVIAPAPGRTRRSIKGTGVTLDISTGKGHGDRARDVTARAIAAATSPAQRRPASRSTSPDQADHGQAGHRAGQIPAGSSRATTGRRCTLTVAAAPKTAQVPTSSDVTEQAAKLGPDAPPAFKVATVDQSVDTPEPGRQVVSGVAAAGDGEEGLDRDAHGRHVVPTPITTTTSGSTTTTGLNATSPGSTTTGPSSTTTTPIDAHDDDHDDPTTPTTPPAPARRRRRGGDHATTTGTTTGA